MFRQARFSNWRRKKPIEGKSSTAKSCHCLSEHFHRSGLEGRVCDELRLRKKAGNDVPPDPNGIKDYRREVRIQLELNGVKLGTYICDYVTEDLDGGTTFIEAKGIAFPLWKQKWAILQGMHRDNPLMRFVVVTK